MEQVKRFCAWCNREIDKEKAVGPPIPKALQKGTHGICDECEKGIKIKPFSFKKWVKG